MGAREVRSDSLDSILTESTSYEMMFAIKDMVKPLKDIVTRYIPDITEIPLEQGIEWLPSWKASPSKRKLSKDQKGSPFAMLHRELEAFIAYMPDQSSFERFGPELLSATFEKDTRIFVEKARAELPLIPLYEAESPGRLAYTTDSGAGKRRVFAIGNFVFQRTLRPLIYFIMKVLRRIPMDGTFDQVRPLDRLRCSIQVYSYDLKSATVAALVSTMYPSLVPLFQTTSASYIDWYRLMYLS
ncbi:RNA-dependent RNA polymerase, mitoviral [Sesbania bispinosa]|nr:RNA-dependent RNA polymerase, mitoviral [Sesbania bispinosa]